LKKPSKPIKRELSVPTFSFRQHPAGHFDRISPEIVNLTGAPPERWRLEPDLLFRLVEDREAFQRQIEAAARSPDGVVHTFRLRHEHTGRVSTVMECRRALLDESGGVCVYEGFWIDLTWWDAAEQRLAAAAWAEALSPVTMGVVHDFNNALTGILSLSEFFHSQTDAQHPFHEGLGLIKNNTHQAARLAHRLMRLHHEQPGTCECRDLNTLASDFMDLLRRVVPKRIAVTQQWATTPLPVKVDPVAFQQTVLFLVLNAVEAIVERGTIHLETSFHATPPVLGHAVGVRPRKKSACLGIVDSGVGIPTDHLARLFEPFFTTKSAKRGLGLGLHLAGSFAESHGGAISAESEQGRGSTFRIWLPFVELE
jgi:signal transduction histidine kinase